MKKVPFNQIVPFEDIRQLLGSCRERFSDRTAFEPVPYTHLNSWMLRLLPAWRPPLMMFIIGTGNTWLPTPPR